MKGDLHLGKIFAGEQVLVKIGFYKQNDGAEKDCKV
jgi:hypothetical protein